MNLLAFVLECAAVVALVGGTASLVVWPLLKVLNGLAWRSAALRAEVAFLLGGTPAIAAFTAVVAAAAPSLQSLWEGTADHCATHSHHLHLCIIHATAVRPPVAAVGAVFLAVVLFRALLRFGSWREENALLRSLEAMGTRQQGRFPVVIVPGSPWLCIAAGILRPRIIVSGTLQQRLDPQELASALAHERAHLVRRDPLAHLLLGCAGLLALPFVARLANDVYRSASEEASDAASAQEIGDTAVVASALLKVASCQRSLSAPATHAAFGEHALERRIRRLFEPQRHARVTSWAVLTFLVSAALAVTGGLVHSGALHHAVETLLHHMS